MRGTEIRRWIEGKRGATVRQTASGIQRHGLAQACRESERETAKGRYGQWMDR